MNSDSLIKRYDWPGVEGIMWKILIDLWGSKSFAFACLSLKFMWDSFSKQANGIETNAVELAASKYGKDPKYSKYIAAVPQIVPNISSW